MGKSSSFTDLKDLSAAIVGLVAGTAPSLVSVSSGRSRSSQSAVAHTTILRASM